MGPASPVPVGPSWVDTVKYASRSAIVTRRMPDLRASQTWLGADDGQLVVRLGDGELGYPSLWPTHTQRSVAVYHWSEVTVARNPTPWTRASPAPAGGCRPRRRPRAPHP